MRVQLAIPDQHVSPEVVEPLLEAGARLNQKLIVAGQAPTFTEALQEGVRWQPEPPGLERFDHAAAVHGRGHGDCDDLVPMRVAELRETGEDPHAIGRIMRTGKKTWHAYVERGDGSWEDPSEEAGMVVPINGIRPPCCRAMTPERRVAAKVDKMAVGAYRSRVEVPWIGGPYKLSCEAIEGDPVDALSTAIAGAYLIGEASGLATPEYLDQLARVEQRARARRGW